jgi:hypothetical protein
MTMITNSSSVPPEFCGPSEVSAHVAEHRDAAAAARVVQRRRAHASDAAKGSFTSAAASLEAIGASADLRAIGARLSA